MLDKLGSLLPADILWYQWIGGTAAMLMMSMVGLLFGMFSPFLAQLTAENSPIPLTLDETSWVASLSNPGRLLGAIIGSVGVQYLGSKRTMFLGGCLFILSRILLYVADSAIWLDGVTLAHGLGIGIAFASCPVFLGEIVSPASRGAVVCYAMSGVPLGSLIGNVLGTYISKELFACIVTVPNIAYMRILLCLPKSPHYLVQKGQMEQAKKSILRYNPKVAIRVELESIQEFQRTSGSLTTTDQLRELMTPRNRKIGIILLFLNMFLQLSGLNTVVYYMEIILTDSMVTVVPPATVVIIANVLDIMAGYLAMHMADKYGRRVTWIVSSGGARLSMFLAGVHFSLLSWGYNSNAQQALPIFAMISFRTFFFLGLFTVPSIMTSELIAPNVKSIVVCITNVSAGFFAFLSTKSYQPMVDAFGNACVSYIHAVIIMMALLFGLTSVPEIKGKSLQEIQKMGI